VPDHLLDEIPSLVADESGSWNWNRMVDDPEYDGRTGMPINAFQWHWVGDAGSRLRVTNFVNAKGGDYKDTIIFSEDGETVRVINGQVSDELQDNFIEWIADEGEIPDDLLYMIPALEKDQPGVFHWNRMVDDPEYDGPTDQPINTFTWKWTDESTVEIANSVNTMAGDYEVTTIIYEKEPVSDELQESFVSFLAIEGGIPEELEYLIPTLSKGEDGEWHWNRMLDNPDYDGPTDQPINTFTWKWVGESKVRVTNNVNAQDGDYKTIMVLKD